MNEIIQFGLILSILYVSAIAGTFGIRLYGRFKLNKETVFTMSNMNKALLLMALSYIFTCII